MALPGTPEGGTAYHEPGGDFSPHAPSFGVSIWLCDANGRPVVTSQTVPLSDIQQRFAPSAHPNIPAIVTKTPYYQATWSRLDATHWELRFKNYTNHVPAILIRSVGPAGGPVTALDWDGEQVGVNHRWAVKATPSPGAITLGDENAAEWMTAQSSATVVERRIRLGIRASEVSGGLGEGRTMRFVSCLTDLQPPFEMPGLLTNALEAGSSHAARAAFSGLHGCADHASHDESGR